MPLLDDIKSVLSFAAFRPEPDDAEVPWNKRFQGRRSLLLNVSRGHVSWRSLNKKGRFQDAGNSEGEFAEVAPQRAEEWRTLTEGGWVNVSINNRFIISLENNLSRRENSGELLRSNPRAVIGAKFDRGKRYALFHHPHSTASLLMACDDSMVKTTEEVLRANGLKGGRICCGLFALLEQKLTELCGSKQDPNASFVIIACCEGSIAALVQQAGQWTDLRCRSGIGSESLDAMIQIIAPLVQKAQPGTPVYFVHDGNDPKFATVMMEQLSKVGGKDITTEDQLWSAIGLN
ncbi:hypothetical protein [Verrucomicrobium sp. BvORR106]|uniref:hypothetical protein n=1 Tax=Verrucomicrobium sp. BvORR106 TaxID=1403819 RepID=UPI000570D45C|nr:hypothetical protein [Verrucomicrobium sp. BvORR106]